MISHWMSIKSAPRNGEDILGWRNGWISQRDVVVKEIFDPEFWMPLPDSPVIHHAKECAFEMLDILETIENNDGKIPEWFWIKIQKAIHNAGGRSNFTGIEDYKPDES